MKQERDEKGRFPPGVSGNPAGRPKGSLSLLTLIKHKLDEIPDGWQETIAERLVAQYIMDVLERKDGTGVRDLVDRLDGKAMQRIQIENEKVAEFVDLYKDLRNDIKREAEGDTASEPEAKPENPDT